MPTYREQPCCECGQLVHKRVRHDRPIYCRACARKRMESVLVQISDKRGEDYDAWLAGMSRWVDREKDGRFRAGRSSE